MSESRYEYGAYRTFDRAQNALEGMFATGDVSPCEQPEIVRRRGVWVITLRDFAEDYARSYFAA